MKFALTEEAQIAFSAKKGSTPAVPIADPATAITDPSLRASYADLEAARNAGSLFPVPGWISTHNEWVTLIFPADYVVPGALGAKVSVTPDLETYRGRSSACIAALFKCAYDDATKTTQQCQSEVLPTAPCQ